MPVNYSEFRTRGLFFRCSESAFLELGSGGWAHIPESAGIPVGRQAVLFREVRLPLEPRALDWNFRHAILSEIGCLSFEMPCLNNFFNPLPILAGSMPPMIGKINEQAPAKAIKPKHPWFQCEAKGRLEFLLTMQKSSHLRTVELLRWAVTAYRKGLSQQLGWARQTLDKMPRSEATHVLFPKVSKC